jgi:molybdopterin-guanine dinucleotide biosynthesis protein A
MGRDKALLYLPEGRTLVERGIETLREAGLSRIVVSVSSARRGNALRAALPVLGSMAVVVDCPPDSGPLAGLCAAMSAFPGHRVALIACDMPHLEPSVLRAMLDEPRTVDALVPIASGQLQPLCAIYGPACLPVAGRLLAGGRLSMRALLAAPELRVRYLDDAWLAAKKIPYTAFDNVNTPTEYAALGHPASTGPADG